MTNLMTAIAIFGPFIVIVIGAGILYFKFGPSPKEDEK